jgi:hypothetical protein
MASLIQESRPSPQITRCRRHPEALLFEAVRISSFQLFPESQLPPSPVFNHFQNQALASRVSQTLILF